MSNTNYESTLFQQRIASGKSKWLFVTVLAVLAMDAIVAAVAISSGVPVKYWIASLLFVIFDLLLVPVIRLCNFRFKHSVLFPWIYAGITVVLAMIAAIGIGSNVFTVVALLFFLLTHLLVAFALICIMVAAARSGDKRKNLVAFLAGAMLVAVAAAHLLLTLFSGYYGQGIASETRNIRFKLDSKTDTYVVEEVLIGISDSVVIPQSYKGKPVAAINGAIFEDRTLRHVFLECDTSVNFLAHDAIQSTEAEILVEKGKIDDLLKNVLGDAKTNAALVTLAEKIKPHALAEDEVYITFTYSNEALRYTNYTPLSVWFGTKGDVFSLEQHARGMLFVDEYDPNSEAVLKQSYQDGAKVLITPRVDGNVIDETAISTSLTCVEINLGNVCAVQIGEDNDGRYESPESFKQYAGSGYRYVLSSDPRNLLGDIPVRSGFDLTWEYAYGSGERKALTDLKSILTADKPTLYPVWSLQAPLITSLTSNATDNCFVYGDDIILNGAGSAPADNIALRYEWVSGENTVLNTGTQPSYTMENVRPAQSGSYTLRVIAYSDTVTTLVSSTESTVELAVGKRPISFNWQLPSTVYSGTDKPISGTLDNTDIINGDSVNHQLNMTSVRNAMTYTLEASIAGNMAELYCVDTADAVRSLVITPYPLTASWQNLSFEYDGTSHVPSASATGVGEEDGQAIVLTVSGGQTNAGENLKAVATSGNPNYTVNNGTQTYRIARREISLVWDTSVTTFEYNGSVRKLSVQSVTGAVAGEENDVINSIRYTGATKNAGSHTMTATIQNTNYTVISGATQGYTVTAKMLTLAWPTNTSLTYNGSAQRVNVTVSGVVAGDNINLSYSNTSSNINVNSYTVSVSIQDSNYSLPSNISCNYQIVKKELTLTWSDTAPTYNGAAQRPTAKVSGLQGGDSVSLSYSTWSGNIDAGSYSVTVSLSSQNYKLPANVTCGYTIGQKALSLTWDANKALTYNGHAQKISATVGGVVAGESVSLSYSVWSGNIDAGDYSVTVSISDDNYKLPSNKSCDYKIQPKSLTLTWDSVVNLTYNGSAQRVGATVTGTVNGESVTLNYSDCSGHINVGTYKVTVSISDTNYKLPTNTTKTYYIVAKELSVEWPDSAVLAYTGSPVSFEADVSGAIGADNLQVSYQYKANGIVLGGAPTQAGTYTVKIIVGNKNYTVSTQDVTAEFSVVAGS